MNTTRRVWLAGALAWLAGIASAEPPALMLAGVYRAGLHLPDYWISEKLDGVRGHWDGQRLLSRGGHVIAAPPWFTAGWPDEPMDGELWIGHGRFEETVSTVRRQMPDDEAWRRVRFMVFDLPRHGGTFTERVQAMQSLAARSAVPWLQAIAQQRGSTEAALRQRLERTLRAGGEGLMLHRGDALYRSGRSDDILKLKPHDDAEAQVVAHLPGRGRNAGLVGALLVHTPDGRRFRLGSGLTDELRRHPPPVGSWVTYRHQGLTERGLPRFPRFMRVRADAELNQPRSPS